MSKAIASCDFLHQGIDYKRGEGVELDEKQLNALSNAGLVELPKEPVKPPATKDKEGGKKEDPPEPAKPPATKK